MADQETNGAAPEAAAKDDDAAAKPVSKPAGKKGQIITVKGPERGRRRAGRRFGPNPEEIDLSTISVDEYEAIKADPELSVSKL